MSEERFAVVDLNVHDSYPEGFPEDLNEPLFWYTFGPFHSEKAAEDWGNRNLQFFGVAVIPLYDPREDE